jgi:protein required for attachment to host cells
MNFNGEADPLVIAADPKTLGQIRQHCHKQLQSRIVGEVAKDLTNQPMEAIERALVMA